jgi:hypothetical protein
VGANSAAASGDTLAKEAMLAGDDMMHQGGISRARHSTAQHGTARHSTAQHGTARHSTAQHGTARHSAAQHSGEQQMHGGVSTAESSIVDKGGSVCIPLAVCCSSSRCSQVLAQCVFSVVLQTQLDNRPWDSLFREGSLAICSSWHNCWTVTGHLHSGLQAAGSTVLAIKVMSDMAHFSVYRDTMYCCCCSRLPADLQWRSRSLPSSPGSPASSACQRTPLQHTTPHARSG